MSEVGIIIETPFGPPGSTSGMSGTIAGNHIYHVPGTYIVSFMVSDDEGASVTDEKHVTVFDNRPVAFFTANPNPSAYNQIINFDASESSAGRPDRSIVRYDWDFGDGSTATGKTIFHAYSTSGTYTARLTVTDNNVPPKTAYASNVINVNQAENGIPEFPTVALPIIAVIGLMLLFQRRKGK